MGTNTYPFPGVENYPASPPDVYPVGVQAEVPVCPRSWRVDFRLPLLNPAEVRDTNRWKRSVVLLDPVKNLVAELR